jgi:glycosyltransferase involved in cell wall biosynthesis
VGKLKLPKVSIMTLCHTGRGKLLIRAVNSVLSQTYPNWELIILDDCSTDFTYEIAKLLAKKDKRIKVYRNSSNLGSPKSRANAAEFMTGDLLCHVDSDDYIYPHALATMVKTFLKNPELGFAYSDMGYGDEEGGVFDYLKNIDPNPNLAYHGWRSLGMYTRKAYENTEGYNRKLDKTCEDGDLFMQIADKFPIARVPHVLYVINNGGEHTSVENEIDCKTCPCRMDCNYAEVWARHANYDLESWEEKEAS